MATPKPLWKKLISLSSWRGLYTRCVRSESFYAVARATHKFNLPKINGIEQAAVRALESEGVFVTSLAELDLSGTDEWLACTDRMIPYIRSGPSVELGGYYAQDIYSYRVPFLTLSQMSPEFYLWALNPRLLSIASHYIGVQPACIGADLRRDINEGMDIGNRRWHYDVEEPQFKRAIKLCVYLTDVTEDSTCFEYIPLEISRTLAPDAYDDAVMEKLVSKRHYKQCLGPRGTVILAATNLIYHRGRVTFTSTPQDRISAWFIYTSRFPFDREHCKQQYSKEALDALRPHLTREQKPYVCWY